MTTGRSRDSGRPNAPGPTKGQARVGAKRGTMVVKGPGHLRCPACGRAYRTHDALQRHQSEKHPK